MAAAAQVKQPPSGCLIAKKVLNDNHKDVLRTIRFTFEWAQTCFKDLGDLLPFSANHLVTLTKGGEDALSFSEYRQSVLKTGHTFSAAFKEDITTTISNFGRNILDMGWNFFKVCKSLKSYQILALSSKFFVNLMAFGGLSFAATSFDKMVREAKTLFKLKHDQDTEIVVRLYRIAKYVGTLAIGIMVSLKAIFGIISPGVLMLTVGTTILVSNFAASIITETHQLKLKSDYI